MYWTPWWHSMRADLILTRSLPVPSARFTSAAIRWRSIPSSWKRIEQWRATDRNGRLDAIGKAASHVHDAASFNLGTDDQQRIQLVPVP